MEVENLKKELEKVNSKLIPIIIDYLRNGFSVESIVIVLLRMAAVIASATGCSEETFLKLAQTSFKTREQAIMPFPTSNDKNKPN